MNLRNKSQKRQGAWKKVVSMFLALCMIVTMMPVSQMTVKAADQVTVKAHFKNTANWSGVGLYTWGEGNPGGDWPGTKINENEEYPGWYSADIVKDNNTKLNYIFNGSGGQTADLAIEASQFTGDVFEVWVTWNTTKGDEIISYERPAEWGPELVSPEINGNQVTFRYKSKSATSVAISGDMTDWVATDMAKDESGVYTHTVTVEPGVYAYEFVVDGSAKPDASNSLTVDGMSALYMPCLVNGTVNVVQGEATQLPKMLTEVMADGTEKQTYVEYDVNSANVTLSGNTVTVADSFDGEDVYVTATSSDKSAMILLNVVDNKIVSPQVSGNSVTFVSDKEVSVAGSMNNWEKVALESVSENGIYSTTMYVGAGNYAYQFFVGDVACKDDNNILTNGNKSRLIVPGLADAKYQAVKGRTFYLPTQLDAYAEDGSAQKVAVTYSTDAEGVTIDNTKHAVTVDEAYAGNQVKLTATAGELKSTVTIDLVNDENKVTINLHYNRPDGDYSNSDAWVWPKGKDGASYKIDSKTGVATIVVEGRANTSVGYIVNKNGQKDWDGDRYIEFGNIVHGTIDCYVESGVEEARIVYGDDVVVGTKVSSAKYDTANDVVVVTTSEPIVGNPLYAFSAKKLNGDALAITSVSVDKKVYTIKLDTNLGEADLIERIAGYKLTYDGYDYSISMPNEYSSEEFENLYTYEGKDLGATWTKDKTTFKLWAPTAQDVKLNLYKSGTKGTNDLIETLTMVKGDKGVWSVEKAGNLNGKYYTYSVTVNGQTNEVCDPYARTTGVNGNRAMVIDLDSTDPAGWAQDESPNKGMNYTDAVIYELHVRDLSSNPNSGIKNTGKFLGLAERGTRTPSGQLTGLDHLIDMGITHLHILPFYDYGSVDETRLDTPQFNWGYDPVNYNVPEGSYSTDPYNGEVRVKELKQTVKTLHESNINVVMDVVYNHVYAADKFCFNQIVPQYFSRVKEDGTYSSNSGCGNDTASERSMVKKYIVDSVKYWADEYHIDGFRFDLVGLIDTVTINEIVTEVHKTHPDVLFYGEGWSMSDFVTKENVTMATQVNSVQTPGFAYFSDTIRDGLRGSVFEATQPGFMVGATGRDARIAKCLQAISEADTDAGIIIWSTNPSQTVNYASCHDNHTLKDRINNTAPNATEADRIKMNNLAAVTYMTAQGIPFIHAGEEILRTKVHEDGTVEHNSYNSNDFVNMIRWENLDKPEYQQVNEYYKGLIEFRKNHKALRLTTADEVSEYVTTAVLESNLIFYSINAEEIEGEVADGIVVIVNANATEKEVAFGESVMQSGDWKVCVNDKKAGTDVIEVIKNGVVKVPAYSAVVLVNGETVDNNSVYVKNARAALVTLDKTTATVKTGETVALTATVKPGYAKDATVTWTSSDASVATVDAKGVVTAVKAGTAVITAKAGNAYATCTVTVTDSKVAVSAIKLSNTKMTILKGKKATLTATVEPANATNKTITWSSSDTKIATVDNAGNITAKKGGKATITAQSADGVQATCEVTVAEVKLNATKMTLQVGKSTTALKVETKWPSNDKVKSWKSSNKKVVTVTSKGKIKGIKKGTATITVTMKSGAKATCKVTVQTKKVVTKKLTINKKKATVKKGKSIQLTVKRNPISATEKITWTSSNKKIATVSSKGKVKAKKAGKVTITAKTSNGKKVTCTITVTKK